MPFAPLQPCSEPRCWRVSDESRCPIHRRKAQARAGTTTEQGYGQDHKRMRLLCFERDAWRCVKCKWEPDIVSDYREAGLGVPPTAAVLEELRVRYHAKRRHLHADHIVPVEVRRELRLDLSNMQTLCDLCHAKKTNAERVEC